MNNDNMTGKENGLLSQDYADPCPECGAVVFDWWDGCHECDGTGTTQATLFE